MHVLTEFFPEVESGRVQFFCFGCKCPHYVNVAHCDTNPQRPVWGFNGSYEKPTFTPSVLVDLGQGRVCHSFVTDGRIQYLTDSFHELAGQTVDLKAVAEWPDEWF